jgi:hypothetical protein
MSVETEATERRHALASHLQNASPGAEQLRVVAGLLRTPPIDDEAATLDAHLRVTKAYVDAVEQAIARLDKRDLLALQASAIRLPGPRLHRPDDLVDAIATWILAAASNRRREAVELAVAVGRLTEECSALQHKSRKTKPLGRGFEAQQRRRLELRFQLLPERTDLTGALHEHLTLLMEEPDEGVAQIMLAADKPLSARDREWIEAERFVGMLRKVRRNKTEGGHIRWFLRKSEEHSVVLDRYGAHGHWVVAGDADAQTLTRAGTAFARAAGDSPSAEGHWRTLLLTARDAGPAARGGSTPPVGPVIDKAYVLGDAASSLNKSSVALMAEAQEIESSSPLIGLTYQATTSAPAEADVQLSLRVDCYALTADASGLSLSRSDGDPSSEPLVSVPHDAEDSALLGFFDVVARVSQAAHVVDAVEEQYSQSRAAQWTRALLSQTATHKGPAPSGELAGSSVRLVYLTASREHPLGGMPLIGVHYLRDHLERLGATAEVVSMAPEEIDSRLVELLSTDVIGISVYLTNVDQVADLVRMLREAGFAGRIVLGGPELRAIDEVAQAVTGWDALIRGEGEEALPEVLRIFEYLEAGNLAAATSRARGLRGVVIAHGRLLLMADTASRSAVEEIRCPLPFEWRRGPGDTPLQMNFTRGCPYGCGFCPNHQGQKFHASDSNEMWRYTALAVADALTLAPAYEQRCAEGVQAALGVDAEPRLRLALDLLLRGPVEVAALRQLRADLDDLMDYDLISKEQALRDALGLEEALGRRLGMLDRRSVATPWEAKQIWLLMKAVVLATALRRGTAAIGPERPSDPHGVILRPFELMTSEDNTLVNRDVVMKYLKLRRDSGLSGAVIFNPGQNTVRDLTDHKGGLDLEYLGELTQDNPFKIVLGSDGTSNPVLRQNHKPFYGVADIVAVNAALELFGHLVLNNYILLSPETDLLEAVEAMALFVLLPVTWRDHGESINLRITKESGTLSHDEGLLFEPADEGYNDPFRFPEVQDLLDRWKLTSFVHSEDLAPLLWRILEEDEAVAQLLPLVVRRWARDFEADPVLAGLAARINDATEGGASLVGAMHKVADEYRKEWPVLFASTNAVQAADQRQSTTGPGTSPTSRRRQPPLEVTARRRPVSGRP